MPIASTSRRWPRQPMTRRRRSPASSPAARIRKAPASRPTSRRAGSRRGRCRLASATARTPTAGTPRSSPSRPMPPARSHAVQQIYLTSDGRKAPVKVQKRTNKARDDWSDLAAVRLPGSRADRPAEGVETALSVWQATGYETWACLGISNIARAPVPDGVPIVVARDGDEAGSKADQQIRQRDHDPARPGPPGHGGRAAARQGLQRRAASRTAKTRSGPASRRRSAPTSTPPRGAPDCSATTRASPGRSSPTPSTHCAMRRSGTASSGTTSSRPRRSRASRRPGPLALQDWEDLPWSDRDDYLVAEWLQRQGIMAPASVAGQAVETVARDRVFHPVREYLDGARVGRRAPPRPLADDLPRRRRRALRTRRRRPLADLGGRADLHSRRQGRLRPDPRGSAGHQEVQRAA